jgi:hypothetical protein
MKRTIRSTFASAVFGILLITAGVFAQSADFISVAEKRVEKSGMSLDDICPTDSDPVAERVFAEYGAVFVSRDTVDFPTSCVFASGSDVQKFQNSVETATVKLGGTVIELQKAAMADLLAAVAEAKAKGLNITPRGSSSAGKRSYADTARIWDSRFYPALAYWQKRGKISVADANAAKRMATQQQVVQVMEWEAKGFWFNTNFSRTIFSSVAAPGTSQHLSMLAIDVSQYADARVRAILNAHGWFQTIANDTPHFTYLGYAENELPKRGLRSEKHGGFTFWVPNL